MSTIISEDDIERLELVRQDLIFLQKEWDQAVEDESLRRSSNVLRNFLVYDELGKAWRSIGLSKQPKITSPNLASVVEGIELKNIVLAQAGGANYNSMKIATILQVNYAFSDEDVQEQYRRGPHAIESTFWLSEFMNSPCIISNGVIITRRELIQYVANKLGGTHLDLKRDLQKLSDIKYSMLDSIRKTVKIADKSAVYFELLSIGQCVSNSKDIELLINRITEILELE